MIYEVSEGNRASYVEATNIVAAIQKTLASTLNVTSATVTKVEVIPHSHIFKDESDAHMWYYEEFPEAFCLGKESANDSFEDWLTDYTVELIDGRLALVEI